MQTMFSIIFLLTLSICSTIANQIQQKPTGFSAKSYNMGGGSGIAHVGAAAAADSDDYDAQAQTPIGYRTRLNDYNYDDQSDEQQSPPPPPSRSLYQIKKYPIQQHHHEPQSNVPLYTTTKKDKNRKINSNEKPLQAALEKEEEEQEEPDRLSVLLLKSTFKCNDRVAGYYADESLGCEVFHYCQENQRHSWICPEGFTFHQVHLICMPPSGENICEDSSKYHIVNEYLYKPINVEEHQSKPNVTLRYSERYYPDTFYHDERQINNNYDDDERIVHSHRHPVQVGFNSRHHQQLQQELEEQQQKQRTYIQRKPFLTSSSTTSSSSTTTTTTTPRPSPSPIPYHYITHTPVHQTVFRSPEEINISLQQRRPHIYLTTSTPRYIDDDEDYQYDK